VNLADARENKNALEAKEAPQAKDGATAPTQAKQTSRKQMRRNNDEPQESGRQAMRRTKGFSSVARETNN
jgi:hypothetical protein